MFIVLCTFYCIVYILYCLRFIVLCCYYSIVLFHRLCTRVGLLPPGVNSIAVNNNNKSYVKKFIPSTLIVSKTARLKTKI
jgi:hypothetical protein